MALNEIGKPFVDEKLFPLVRLHGCTDKGISVVCLLQGLYPYVKPPLPIPQLIVALLPDWSNI